MKRMVQCSNYFYRKPKDGHLLFPGVGQGDDSIWQPEDSFLVCGITLEAALELAGEFGQYAIAFHTLGLESVIEFVEIGKTRPATYPQPL